MQTRSLSATELRAAAFRGVFLYVTVLAFVVAICLVVLDWTNLLPGGTGNGAAVIIAAWALTVLIRAWRSRAH
jgi:hypothetical protein